MPNIPATSSLQIQPKTGLGPLFLGASLYSTLNTLLQHKSTFPRLNILFNSTSPVSNPVYIDLEANGLRLRFDGESQHLELIEVTEFGKLAYDSRHGAPSFRSIYKTVGPTSPGELLPASSSSPAMYILSYPGIAWKFPVPSDVQASTSNKELLNLLHKAEPPCLAMSLVIFSGESWSQFRSTLSEVRLPAGVKKRKRYDTKEDDSDQVEFAEIIPSEKIEVTFESGKTVSLTYGTFSVQDAITLLGPPSEVYTKSDTRLNIHNGTSSRHNGIEPGPLSAASDYFYNYFSYGLSLLFSPSQNHTLQKVLLHANLPQSHAFHRFNRIQWILAPVAHRKKDSTRNLLTSESNFEEIKACLEKISGPIGKPMIVNRGGQGSPSSSVELVSDDILTAPSFGCTELFGFVAEGLVFEVLEGGWVGQVTCFRL